jgi:hypothetical protein
MAVCINTTGIKFSNGKCLATAPEQYELWVYNCNWWTPCNGGRCCYWTVPTGVTSLKFEIVSGGGPGGSSGGDYDFGIGGQGGNYGSKTLQRSVHGFGDGTGYRLCAASSSMCSCCCRCNGNDRHGCPSFACGTGIYMCARGGRSGSTNWDMVSSCYNCHIGNVQCDRGNYNAGWVTYNCFCVTGHDMHFRGTSGSMYKGVSCCSHMFSVAGGPSGPFNAPHGVGGKDMCTGNLACCSAHAAFPGGGGPGHGTASRNACWGSFGQGGLVKLTYS